VLDSLKGVDTYLDDAINYVIDGEEIEDDEDSYENEE
jgi:hypothetical protein